MKNRSWNEPLGMTGHEWGMSPSVHWCDNYPANPSSSLYVRQWIVSTLVQIMACRLFGAKPLSEPMLGYCLLDIGAPFSEILTKIQNFSFTKMHLKTSSAKRWPFCTGGDELKIGYLWKHGIYELKSIRNPFSSLDNDPQDKPSIWIPWKGKKRIRR